MIYYDKLDLTKLVTVDSMFVSHTVTGISALSCYISLGYTVMANMF